MHVGSALLVTSLNINEGQTRAIRHLKMFNLHPEMIQMVSWDQDRDVLIHQSGFDFSRLLLFIWSH